MRVLLTLVALLSCLQFQAYAAANKIVLVETMPVPVVTNHTKAILSALKDIGYVDGGNIELEILKANGSRALAAKLLKESITKHPPPAGYNRCHFGKPGSSRCSAWHQHSNRFLLGYRSGRLWSLKEVDHR